MELLEHLKKVKFDKYLNKLNKITKNKTVIIYGAGALFQTVNDKYDLSKFNIIGISDIKYNQSDEGKEFLGYKIIPKEKMADYNPDIVLIATLKYLGIMENFADKIFFGTKTKVYPLVKVPYWDLIKEIWSK